MFSHVKHVQYVVYVVHHIKQLCLFRRLLQSLYELREASKFWWNRFLMDGQKSIKFHSKYFHLCFEDDQERHEDEKLL